VYASSGVCSNLSTVYTMTSGTGSCTATVTWAADDNYTGATRTQTTTAEKITPTVTFTGAPANAAYLSAFTVASSTNSTASPVYTSGGVCSNLGTAYTMTSGTGSCTSTVTWAADANFSGATLNQSTSARKITPTVTVTGAPPSAAYPSAFTMTSGTGSCTATVTWAADDNCTGATRSQTTTAEKINPIVTFTGAPASAAYLGSFTVASTTNSSATPVYTSAGVCTNLGTAYTMTSGTGSCTSTVTWAADDNYTAATRSQTTTAEKINPIDRKS